MPESRPKILAISYLFPSSTAPDYGVFVLNRLKALAGRCEIRVINPVPWFPFLTRFKKYRHLAGIPEREVLHGIEVFHPRFFMIPGVLKFLDGLFFLAAAFPLALKIKRAFDFHLIDVHWTYPDLPAGRLVSRVTGRPQLVTLRGKEALYPGEKSLRHWMIRKGIASSHAVVALSRELGADAVELGADPAKVRVIRNGVDLDTFFPEDRAAARNRLGLRQEDVILLSVGSLIHRKGHDRVIRAMASVLKVRPEARLYILGSQGPEGDYRNALKTLVQDLDLADRVVFRGHVPHGDLRYWYNAADLFCLLSRGEGSPNVLTEALACGCPAVATKVGAVDEILDRPFLGSIAPEDEEGIAHTLTQAAARSWDREQIARHMSAFGWDWCADQVMDLYLSLLKQT